NQDESNGDKLGNQDYSENNTHPKDFTAVDLNELDENVSNNRHAVLNEDKNLSTRSNNGSEKTIQIRIKSIFELWNFFISYLNTGLLQ
ncbi:2070_t:CDS:2, partial [Racocetra persica]